MVPDSSQLRRGDRPGRTAAAPLAPLAPLETPPAVPLAAAPLASFVRRTALLVLVLGVGLYLPTFRCSWAYDDMDYLNFAAAVLAGRQGYWSAVFHPHLEHLVPLVRMAFHASAALFGAWALPFRLAVFLAHVGAGLFMALVARRYTGSNAGGWAAAVAYVLPAGFSSVWIWLMTGAGVPLGLFGLTGALAALAWSGSLGRARARGLAAAGLLVAAAAESTLVPLFLSAVLLDEIERRRAPGAPPRRAIGPFTVAVLGAAAVAMAAAAVLYRRVYGHAFVLDFRHGLPRALFLLLSAPFRYLFPGLPLSRPGEPDAFVPVHGSLLGLVAAACGLVLVGLGRRFPAVLAAVAAAVACGPLSVLLLVGLGRAASTFGEIYDADRYYFTLLLPISLLAAGLTAGAFQAAAGWSPARRRAAVLLLAGGLAAEAVLHRDALLARVPFAIFVQHERRFAQLARLDDALARAARRVPAGQPAPRWPEGDLFFSDVHNGRVSSALLLNVVGRGRTGVVLAAGGVGERDERLLNPALDEWAREIGEPVPYLRIAGGRLVDSRRHVKVDFNRGDEAESLVSGFEAWEGGSRWMGPRGVLRLTAELPALTLRLGAPVLEIARRFPARPPLAVKVSITDQVSGGTVPIGTVTVGPGDDFKDHLLDATPFFRVFGAGRTVLLVLEAGPGWRPSEVLPPSRDERLLTVRVAAAGFASRR